MFDLAKLADKINQERTSIVRIVTNAGKTLDLPPGTHAYHDQFELYLHWPPINPEKPYAVSRSIALSSVNIASVEYVTQDAA